MMIRGSGLLFWATLYYNSTHNSVQACASL